MANGNCQDSDEDTHYQASIKTTKGVALDIFAKCAKFNEDIYSKFLAPYYKTDMYAETWQRGEPEDNFKSFCREYKVENVKSIILSDDVKFPSLDDHSKWAITATDSESRICIGDINRQVGQKERCGGMVCAELPEVRKTYESFISGIEKCEDERDEL
ncbi:plancitoxin-1-like [Ptychodera flava]|uniref:plancitoxin-1-like n=1 Tax=Ptychodera flava TaxID=63121 RepID=UPI00396A25D3